MKLLLLLLSFNVLAGTSQVNNIGQVGGGLNTSNAGIVQPYSTLSNLIQLSSYVAAADSVNNGFMMLSRWASTGSSGQYQVANGKTFRMVGLYLYTNSATVSIMLGYGTAALASAYTSTAPTGVIYYSSSSTVYGIISDVAATWKFFPISAEFPQNSYPFVKNKDGGFLYNTIIIGTEQ